MNSHITMKEMAVSEQPCEKCFRYGAHCLSDAELLAVILRTGTRDITALQLAQSFFFFFFFVEAVLYRDLKPDVVV